MHHTPLSPLEDQNEPQYRSLSSDIQEFRRLVEETTGEDMTDLEDWEQAIKLITLYRMSLSPIPEDPGAEVTAGGLREGHASAD